MLIANSFDSLSIQTDYSSSIFDIYEIDSTSNQKKNLFLQTFYTNI